MKSSSVIVSAVALAATVTFVSVAQADGHMSKDKGFYVGASALGAYVDDFDFNNARDGQDRVKHTAEFDPGFGVLLRGGYDYGTLRTDVELGYRRVDLDSVDDQANPDGEANLYTAMLNGTWDYENDSGVIPYLSLGAGVTIAEGDLAYDMTTSVSNPRQTKNFYGIAPTGQVGVGLGYGLSDNVDLVGGYSLMATPTDKAGEDEVLLVHSLQLGFNYKF